MNEVWKDLENPSFSELLELLRRIPFEMIVERRRQIEEMGSCK